MLRGHCPCSLTLERSSYAASSAATHLVQTRHFAPIPLAATKHPRNLALFLQTRPPPSLPPTSASPHPQRDPSPNNSAPKSSPIRAALHPDAHDFCNPAELLLCTPLPSPDPRYPLDQLYILPVFLSAHSTLHYSKQRNRISCFSSAASSIPHPQHNATWFPASARSHPLLRPTVLPPSSKPPFTPARPPLPDPAGSFFFFSSFLSR